MIDFDRDDSWWFCIGGCGRNFSTAEFPNDDTEGICEGCWQVLEMEMDQFRQLQREGCNDSSGGDSMIVYMGAATNG